MTQKKLRAGLDILQFQFPHKKRAAPQHRADMGGSHFTG
jgi:hypothetical protein